MPEGGGFSFSISLSPSLPPSLSSHYCWQPSCGQEEVHSWDEITAEENSVTVYIKSQRTFCKGSNSKDFSFADSMAHGSHGSYSAWPM